MLILSVNHLKHFVQLTKLVRVLERFGDIVTNKFSLDLLGIDRNEFNVCIAVEIIKKVLFKNDDISSKELSNVIAIANRSVKANTKLN